MSVESLLRLKRVEKPSVDFWTQFEHELRAKQLAAILPKRSSWRMAASRRFRQLTRFQIPIGVAAAFAAIMGGIHQYRLVTLSRSRLAPQAEMAGAALASAAAPSAAALAGSATTVAYREPMAGHATSRLPVWVAGLGVMSPDNSFESDTPSARSIAANLAAVQSTQPEILRRLLGLSQAFDERLVPARRPITEPLARIVAPAEERRARLLAGVVTVSATQMKTAPASSDRFVRRLSDDRLYDEAVSRYRLGGDHPSLSIKF